MFDMSNDSHLFRTRHELEADGWRLEGNRFVRGDEVYLPLYEAKMTQLWDHRAAERVFGCHYCNNGKPNQSRISIKIHRCYACCDASVLGKSG